MDDKFYTVNEVCNLLRIGKTKVYYLFGTGELRAVSLGKKTLVARSEIERFLASLPPIQMQRGMAQDAGKEGEAP